MGLKHKLISSSICLQIRLKIHTSTFLNHYLKGNITTFKLGIFTTTFGKQNILYDAGISVGVTIKIHGCINWKT